MGNVLLGGAHNPQGVGALCAYLQKYLDPARTVLLTGMLADKDVTGMCAQLADRARQVVTVAPPVPRAMDAQELAARLRQAGAARVTPCEGVREALELARSLAAQGDAVVCAGSLYLIGALRTLLEEREHGI